MSHDHIVKGEIRCRSKRQVTHNQRIYKQMQQKQFQLLSFFWNKQYFGYELKVEKYKLKIVKSKLTVPGCPLVSWIMTRSVTLLALQAWTRALISWPPLFMRWAPGKISFTSCGSKGYTSATTKKTVISVKVLCDKGKRQTFANIFSRELGSLEVVTMTLGSSTPAHLYSSSMWELTPAKRIFYQSVCHRY